MINASRKIKYGWWLKNDGKSGAEKIGNVLKGGLVMIEKKYSSRNDVNYVE